MVYRTNSELAALAHAKMLHTDALEQLQHTPRQGVRTPRSKLAPAAGFSGRPPSRQAERDRALLQRLLLAALFVAFLTGSTSYRMHLAMRNEQEPVDSEAGSAALFAGLRSWFDGGSPASRRSLRERPGAPTGEGEAAAGELAAPGMDPLAVGVQLNEHWYLLGIDSAAQGAAAAEEEQQQQEGGEESALQRLLRKRKQQKTAVRLYNLESKAWVHKHNLTKFPSEVPVARWAATSLLNKAKKKESIIFLLGGHMSPSEAAAGRPPRPKPPPGTAKRASASSHTCPQASSGVFSMNPTRGRVRALPPLPAPRFGGTAVVLGARLHYMGGFATDRNTRLASPAAEHWSIGLNADGSSAPEWRKEAPLPAALLGAPTAVALTPEDETGEPVIHAWARVSSRTHSGPDAACFADSPAAAAGHPTDAAGAATHSSSSASSSSSSDSQGGMAEATRLQLWAYNSSSGWRELGPLPQPLAEDVQCAVAASSHDLLAVGAVERSGLFTRQRGIWQYDAHHGGTWTRAGWAPLEFEGPLCAVHGGRLFISSALPPEERGADAAADSAKDAADADGSDEEAASTTTEAESGGESEGAAASGAATQDAAAAAAAATE